MVEERGKLFPVNLAQGRLVKQLAEIAHEDALEQAAIGFALIADDVVAFVDHAAVADGKVGTLAGIVKIGLVACDLEQMVGSTCERA